MIKNVTSADNNNDIILTEVPNEETKQAIQDLQNGVNVTTYDSIEKLMEGLYDE